MSTAVIRPLRSYCHPMDKTIIRILDNPVTDVTVKKIVQMNAELVYGQVLGSGIPVNERSFPEVNEMVEHCSKVLRIKRPYVIISSSIGFNAFTLGTDENPSIVLGSMLVKALSKEHLRFVIGHECGHIAMGHVTYTVAANILASFATNVPVLGDAVNYTAGTALNAWSRRSEITADRAGLICCGSPRIAKEALMQLELGFVDIQNSSIDAYVENSIKYRNGGILRRIGEYGQAHPLLPKRIEAIDLFMQSELLYQLAGKEAPNEAICVRELNRQIEKLIRVI